MRELKEGMVFGKWTVLTPKLDSGDVELQCECGETGRVSKSRLLNGKSRQCSVCVANNFGGFKFGQSVPDQVPQSEEQDARDKQMIEEFLNEQNKQST